MFNINQLFVIFLSVSFVSSATIKRFKRQNEIYDDNFLAGNHVNLPVPAVNQSLTYSCGPAVASALLRFWGFTGSSLDMDGTMSGNLFVDSLIISMYNENFGPIERGTSTTNFINELNRRIVRNHYNSGRRYMERRLTQSALHVGDGRTIHYNQPQYYLRLAREIYNSLINRAPPVLLFSGRFTALEPRRNHYIVLTGINIRQDGVTFSYMDPAGGVHGTFEVNSLNFLFENGGALLYHSPVNPTGVVNPSGPFGTFTPPGPSGPSLPKDDCPTTPMVTGGYAGLTAGLISGATVGSSVPIVGTFLGALIGGAAGLLIGGTVGATASEC